MTNDDRIAELLKAAGELTFCLGAANLGGQYARLSMALDAAAEKVKSAQSESAAFFKQHELEALAKTPDALELLADWHECQISMADAINDMGVFDRSIKYHEGRKDELAALAKKLREAE